MNVAEANKVFRKAILDGFFEPQLAHLGFQRSTLQHPTIDDYGLVRSNLLHIFFDVNAGLDYPDGDEWFIVDMLFPYNVGLPDFMKSADYFTAIIFGDKTCWHHRELVRYKYGKSKKLDDALEFLESKYEELHALLVPVQKDIN